MSSSPVVAVLFSALVLHRAWDVARPDAVLMLQAVLKKALRNVDWSQFVQEEQQVVEGRITLKRQLAPTSAPAPASSASLGLTV